MAILTRFDYSNLKVDKILKRRPSNWSGATFFGGIEASTICSRLMTYHKKHIDEFEDGGKMLTELNSGKKWIRWLDISSEEGYCKLLFSFNDQQVDDRIIEDKEVNRLAQRIPDTHGQRTVLHVIIKTEECSISSSNLCVQHIPGMTKRHIKLLFESLLQLFEIEDPEFWKESDSVTESEVTCKPHIEIKAVTSDDIIDAINNGLLRGVQFVERKKSNEEFDIENKLKQSTKILQFRLDNNEQLFKGSNTFKSALNWVNRIREHNSDEFQDTPRSYLIIKHPQTGAEINREISEGVLDGFTKREYIEYEDRELDTIKQINSQEPVEVTQFFQKMADGF